MARTVVRCVAAAAAAAGSLLLCAQAAAPATAPPQQIRLALTGDPTEMLAYWATSNTTTAPDYVSTVWFGVDPGNLTTATGPTSNYSAYNISSPFLHHAVMTGLSPNTMYFYQVGDPTQGVSALLNFTSAPLVGDSAAYPVRFIAYGDMGIENSQNTSQWTGSIIEQGGANLLLHVGDISYADDRAGYNNGSWYDGIVSQFYNQVQLASQHAPYMLSSGNHEAILNFTAFIERVSPTMPSQRSGGSDFWYSFDYGPVHYVAFDTDQNYTVGSPQYNWIMNDLIGVNRSVTPWVVAYNHFPFHCSNYFWCPDATQLRLTYEAIFNAPETKVDIYIAGHVHAAEILYPCLNGSLVQQNFSNVQQTFNIIVGFSGDMEVCCNTWIAPKPDYSFWRADDVATDGGFFGFSMFSIVNETHFRVDIWNSTDGSIVEELWVSVDRGY